jgi:hypothetical protein
MKRTRVVLAVFGVLALAGGGTALAAKGKGNSPRLRAGFVGHKFHGHGQLLQTAASYLGLAPTDLATRLRGGTTLAQIAGATQGKTVQGLVDALVTAEKRALADAVTAKRLTQAQADAIAKELPPRTTDFVNGALRGPGFRGGPGFHSGHWDDLQVVADYLGTPVSSVVTQLMSGKTLGAIANATSGKSASGLIAALVAHEKTEHSGAPVDDLTHRVTAVVNNAFPPRPQHGFFRHR